MKKNKTKQNKTKNEKKTQTPLSFSWALLIFSSRKYIMVLTHHFLQDSTRCNVDL